MKTRYSPLAYILIGTGIFFLLKELKLPIFTDFYSWPTLLIIVGAALLFHGYKAKDHQHLFSGTVILGLGIHFHGKQHYIFWVDNWAVYILIIGIAYIIRALKTKKGYLIGIVLISVSLLLIFSVELPAPLNKVYQVTAVLDTFWPVILIVLGFYWLKKK
ncbi:LiaI-LiaF-like domain-containing protein [Virgibacillus kekensis]|uniref:LiaI-LiaF-like domain-containing protein n=1 Tax=Virgibacillus kekensis TaxID=202261 RepID=A0ABV9DFN6_9BACI